MALCEVYESVYLSFPHAKDCLADLEDSLYPFSPVGLHTHRNRYSDAHQLQKLIENGRYP